MSQPEIIEKKPVSLAEMKEEMKKISKRDEELSYRAGRTNEYVNQFTTLSLKEFDALKKKLFDLEVPRLKEEHIVKILDFMPSSVEELDVLLQGYMVTVSKESMEKMVSALK